MLRRSVQVMVPAGEARSAATAPDRARAALGSATVQEWRQVGRWWAPDWEAWTEGALLATLHVRGAFRSDAEVETTTGRWRLQRRGWLGAYTVVRDREPEPLLRFRPGWFRTGRIERTAGETLVWKPGWLGHSATVANAEGFEQLTARMRHGLFRVDGEVRVGENGRRLPDIEALSLLAWWLLLSTPRHHGN